jgi:hypothetical protein
LALDTAAGQPVDNCQTLEAVPLGMITGFEEKWGTRLGVRCEPTGRFNCHGMTFAGRRTGIDDPEVVAQILKEDGYAEIPKLGDVLAGDVAVYYSSDGDASHSGIVISTPPSTAILPMAEVVIYSKWGPYRELVHRLLDCPYAENATIKFYRIHSCP